MLKLHRPTVAFPEATNFTAMSVLSEIALMSLTLGLGRKCSKCPLEHFKPSILGLNSNI
jgi:hypothetical protein